MECTALSPTARGCCQRAVPRASCSPRGLSFPGGQRRQPRRCSHGRRVPRAFTCLSTPEPGPLHGEPGGEPGQRGAHAPVPALGPSGVPQPQPAPRPAAAARTALRSTSPAARAGAPAAASGSALRLLQRRAAMTQAARGGDVRGCRPPGLA